jgi:hypothetical protein
MFVVALGPFFFFFFWWFELSFFFFTFREVGGVYPFFDP